MFQSISSSIGITVGLLTCLAAMTLGGATERFGGAFLLVVNFAALVIQYNSDWSGPQYAVMILDIAALSVSLILVLCTDRAWTVGLAAYYLLTVVTHVVILFEPLGQAPAARAWAYITALITWGYLIYACLLWGTFSSWRRRGSPGLPQIRRVIGSQRM